VGAERRGKKKLSQKGGMKPYGVWLYISSHSPWGVGDIDLGKRYTGKTKKNGEGPATDVGEIKKAFVEGLKLDSVVRGGGT